MTENAYTSIRFYMTANEKEKLNLTIDSEIKKEAKKQALDEKRTVSELVEELLSDYIEKKHKKK